MPPLATSDFLTVDPTAFLVVGAFALVLPLWHLVRVIQSLRAARRAPAPERGGLRGRAARYLIVPGVFLLAGSLALGLIGNWSAGIELAVMILVWTFITIVIAVRL
jgi:hypothetical protein